MALHHSTEYSINGGAWILAYADEEVGQGKSLVPVGAVNGDIIRLRITPLTGGGSAVISDPVAFVATADNYIYQNQVVQTQQLIGLSGYIGVGLQAQTQAQNSSSVQYFVGNIAESQVVQTQQATAPAVGYTGVASENQNIQTQNITGSFIQYATVVNNQAKNTEAVNGTLRFIGNLSSIQAVQVSAQSGSVITTPTSPVITAITGDAQNTITWSTVSGAVSYNIYWSADGTDPTSSSTKIEGVTSPYIHTALTNGTLYKYAATSVNAFGESVLSTIISATPVAGSVYSFDGTAGTAVDVYSSFFTKMLSGSGTANLDGVGHLLVNGPSAATDGALVYRTNALTVAKSGKYGVLARIPVELIASNAGGTALQIIVASSKQAPLGSGSDASLGVIDWVISNNAGVIRTYPRYYDASGNSHEYVNSTQTWTANNVSVSAGAAVSISPDAYYWFYIHTTATGWSVETRTADDATALIAKTAEIAWSSTRSAGANSFWLRIGDKYSYAWQFGIYVDTYKEV